MDVDAGGLVSILELPKFSKTNHLLFFAKFLVKMRTIISMVIDSTSYGSKVQMLNNVTNVMCSMTMPSD
jgi:hypothetical protein